MIVLFGSGVRLRQAEVLQAHAVGIRPWDYLKLRESGATRAEALAVGRAGLASSCYPGARESGATHEEAMRLAFGEREPLPA